MYNELAAKLPTEVWGEAGFRRLTVPRCRPAGGSEVDVHPRFCPPAVPSGKVLKRLRHGKALVKSVKFCKQELYGRLGRVEVRRLIAAHLTDNQGYGAVPATAREAVAAMSAMPMSIVQCLLT